MPSHREGDGGMSASGDLRLLLAERLITRVLMRYCQGVDRRDWEMVRSCYHDDAVDNHGAFVGGPDAMVEWLQDRHRTAVLTSMHMLTNVSIRFADDTRLA